MFSTIKILILTTLLCFSWLSSGQEKASDFFKNPSKERNLISSLFEKNKIKNQKNKPFTLAGETGLLVTRGNSDTSMVKLALESTHELEKWSNRYEGQFLQRATSQQGGDSIETIRFEVSGQFDYKLTKDTNRLFAYVEYDDNQFNFLRDQTTVVAGWSQVAWKEQQSEFRYSIGPGFSYIVQERNDRTIKEAIVRGTLLYNTNIGENARFRQILSAEVGEVLTKARSQSSITAKIFEKLAMKLTLNLTLNENVADQEKVFSSQTSISMVYQFF